MFLDELDERSGRLVSGAHTLAADGPQAVAVADMRRDGHTIKGTAHVMGYEPIGAAAAVIEAVWDAVASGEVTTEDATLGDALAAASAELVTAGTEAPQSGSSALSAALAALAAVVPELVLPEIHVPPDAPLPEKVSSDTRERDFPSFPSPPGAQPASGRQPDAPNDTPPAELGSESGAPVSLRDLQDIPAEYGGVIGAVESWATEGTVIVNTGRLYRLINRIAATRAEAAALSDLVAAGAPDPSSLRDVIDGLALATANLQIDVLGLASLPVSSITGPLPQLVGYLAKKLGKNVALEVNGDVGVVVDRQVLEAISEPIRQLIVNSIYHGLEIPVKRKSDRKPNIGSLTLDVSLDANMLEIVVADDGAGVDWEAVHQSARDLGLIDTTVPVEAEALLPLLFRSGFTTGAIEGGRGDGLAGLAETVEELHGRVNFETWPGAGTRVSVRVPAWQALQKVLLVWAGGMRWAIPEAAVEHVMSTPGTVSEARGGLDEMDWNGGMIPVMPFSTVAGVDGVEDEPVTIILTHRVGTAAFSVAAVEGSRDVAVTELAPVAAGPDHVRGVALLGAGEVALVIDAGRLVERVKVVPRERRKRAGVLVVDDSEGGRAVLSGSLSSSGFATSMAGSVAEALDVLDEIPIDAVVVDFSMPTVSGIALVEEIRRRDDRMPIVMLSGVASEDDKARAKKAGVDRFFDKSDFREGALVTALWDLLEG